MNFAIGYLSFISSSVFTGIVLAFLADGLNKEIALLSILIGLCVMTFVIFKYKNLSFDFKKGEFGFWSWTATILFFLFSLKAFLWILFKRQDSLNVLLANNLGDMPYHISHIRYFANGAGFWPESHVCSGEKMHYHFGIDFFNSLLVLLGMDLTRSLIWVGILSAIVTMLFLLLWGRAFILSGFLFSGGLSGFHFFHTLIFTDYERSLEWKNIFLAMFIPQRGALYAIPAGLLLLYSWRERFFRGNKNTLPLWIEVLLFSTMPIFHIHTFIFLFLMLFIWLLFFVKNNRLYILRLFAFSFLLILHSIWTHTLENNLKSQIEWISLITLCLVEVGMVLWFWSTTPTIISLFLTGLFYILIGISQIWLDKRLFKSVMWEYIWVAVIIFLVFVTFGLKSS